MRGEHPKVQALGVVGAEQRRVSQREGNKPPTNSLTWS